MRNIVKLLEGLQADCGASLEVLTDKSSERYQEHAKRWSEIDREDPAAIVLPQSEEQVQKTVKWAVQSSVPFVPKSGGHSHWSSIDDNGIVIDLSKIDSIDIDTVGRTATLKGSILAKQVSVALADAGLFTALGNGNSIGAIPYFIGGGVSITSSVTGYGSDQILGARLIDARGDIVDINEESNPELLWAIRGAGQFFGLVTELTIRAHPLSDLGNDQGVIWSGSFVFPIERAKEIAPVMKKIMDDGTYATAGMMMIMAPPPDRKHLIVIGARHVGNPEDAPTAFKTLYDLKPMVGEGAAVPIQNANDRFIEVKEQYQQYGVVGLRRFDAEKWLQMGELWKNLVAECPDAMNTSFNFQWDSRFAKPPGFDSAMSLHDIRYWVNNILWYNKAANRPVVDEYNAKSIELMRGPDESDYADYQNGTRIGPIKRRYRPQSKLEQLTALKKKWDPTGVFTSELLELEGLPRNFSV